MKNSDADVWICNKYQKKYTSSLGNVLSIKTVTNRKHSAQVLFKNHDNALPSLPGSTTCEHGGYGKM